MQKTILLVDDDEEEYYIIKMALEMASFSCRCIWANSLEQAQKLVNELQPDYVFLDINMPRNDGISCLEELKKMEQLQHSLFVMYSTYISDDNRIKALQLGASCCIHKPENIKILLKQLTHLLSDKTHFS
jgi:DNA-binding response OmpR family regulator